LLIQFHANIRLFFVAVMSSRGLLVAYRGHFSDNGCVSVASRVV